MRHAEADRLAIAEMFAEFGGCGHLEGALFDAYQRKLAYKREWYQFNKSRACAAQRAYYKKNRPRISAYDKRRKTTDRDRKERRERARQMTPQQREAKRQYQREWCRKKAAQATLCRGAR